MFHILISDKLGDAGLERLNRMKDISYDFRPGLSKEELLELIPRYDGLIIRSGTQVDADVLSAGQNLKVIGRAGIGVDNIDVTEATSQGIIVMNTPAANSIATAEQTMALMLAVSRHTAVAHQSLLSGKWHRSLYTGVELRGKNLGIIGFGRIGRLVAIRAQAFGMNVFAFDPFVTEETGRELGVTLVDMEDLLPQSDYITLHAALLPETKDLINEATISQMKEGITIINVARGKLIDENALVAALDEGKVKAAAIDVYSSEPPSHNNPLLGHPKVLHTPHLGASTLEAQRAVATEIAEQVADALRGIDFRNAINMPFPAGPEFSAIRPHMILAEKLGSLHACLASGVIRQVEIEVHGDDVLGMVRAIAAAMLKGMLAKSGQPNVNYVNAPALANEKGIAISQTRDKSPIDYPNLISCRVKWDGGQTLLAGMLFGDREPRVVRVNNYRLDVRPEGIMLILLSEDVPGVVGQIGTILAANHINVGEWRMGRDRVGGEAMSVISLDDEPDTPVLEELEMISAVTQVRLIHLE